MTTFRDRLWQVLQGHEEGRKFGRIVNLSLMALIALNVIAVVADTIPWISRKYGTSLSRFELLSVGLFSIEYLLRLWSSSSDPRFQHPFVGRFKYTLTPLAVVDFLSIFPFYFPWLGVDLLPLRLFRLLRLVRILKLGRYSESLQLVGRVLRARKGDLASTGIVAIVLLLIAATLLHSVEATTQPDQFGTLPDCMWWAVVTMTTVGYGDVYPKTPIGKILGAFVAFIGIGMFALPAGILGAGFLEERMRKGKGKNVEELRCPHCGKLVNGKTA